MFHVKAKRMIGIRLALLGVAPSLAAFAGGRPAPPPAAGLAVRAGDRPLDWHDPGAPMTVEIPYDPADDDARESELIVVWSVGADGAPVPVPTGR